MLMMLWLSFIWVLDSEDRLQCRDRGVGRLAIKLVDVSIAHPRQLPELMIGRKSTDKVTKQLS